MLIMANERDKLAEIKLLLQQLLSESEKVINAEPRDFLRLVTDLLGDGYSLRKDLKVRGYDWKTWGTKDDRDFLTFMNCQRADEVHHGGSAKRIIIEQVPFEKVRSDLTRRLEIYHSMPTGPGQTTLQRSVYFFLCDGKPVKIVDCCKRYVALLEQLVEQFVN